MNRKLASVVVAGLAAAGAARAADDTFSWSGSAGIGLRYNLDSEGGVRNGARATSATASTPFQGPEDRAKMNEYRDLGNGLIGNVDLRGGSETYYLRFFGENFDRDDQYLNLQGGSYGSF